MVYINLVVAPNEAYYKFWLNDLNLSPKEYKYISKFDDIIRVEKAKIYFIGEHWLNPITGLRRFEVVKNMEDVELIYE